MRMVETNEYKLTVKLQSGKVITTKRWSDTEQIAVDSLECDYAKPYEVTDIEFLGKVKVMD